MLAFHDPQARTFTMKGRAWFNTYPITDLPKWLTFYRRMQAEHPKAKDSYDADVAALEALAQQLGQSRSVYNKPI